jgi:hypothetical protein
VRTFANLPAPARRGVRPMLWKRQRERRLIDCVTKRLTLSKKAETIRIKNVF